MLSAFDWAQRLHAEEASAVLYTQHWSEECACDIRVLSHHPPASRSFCANNGLLRSFISDITHRSLLETTTK
eukprot:6196009-Pleurochrysis_carterae.AAC.2